MRHLKGLTFDYLSFTEVLFTSLFSTDSEAPALIRSSTTSLLPCP
jgi:hypothetical protein